MVLNAIRHLTYGNLRSNSKNPAIHDNEIPSKESHTKKEE